MGPILYTCHLALQLSSLQSSHALTSDFMSSLSQFLQKGIIDVPKFGCQAHYGSAMQLRTSMKATLRSMVEAGRLERVPEQQNLYRLGGIMRQFAQDADHAEPRPARRAKRRSDPQVQL